MTEGKQHKPLAWVVFLSGVWDLFAALVYGMLVGTVITNPPVDRFYALFIASFLLCFGYLLIGISFNVRRYLFAIGVVIIGRLLYVILLFSSIFYRGGFPVTFWWTGIIDIFWVAGYLVFTHNCGIPVRDLFLPARQE